MRKFLVFTLVSVIFLSFVSNNSNAQQDTCKCTVIKKYKPTPRAKSKEMTEVTVINNIQQAPDVKQEVTVNNPNPSNNGGGSDWWKILVLLLVIVGLSVLLATTLFRSRRTNETQKKIINAVGNNGGSLEVKDGPYRFRLHMNSPNKNTVELRRNNTENQQQTSN